MNSPENNGSSILGVPLQPITVADQVAKVIQERIFSRVLRPGDRVVEQTVAKELGVGQNPVREALIRLGNLGFVQHNAHRGTYVTKMTTADAAKIYRVRAALEMLALEIIIERMGINELDCSHVEGFLLDMKEAAKRADIVGFYNSDLQFHRALWRLADDEYLFQALERLVVPLFAFFIMQRYYPPENVQLYFNAIASHERMVEAVKNRSTENVRAAFAQPLMPPDELVTTS
jgi:DNA-binding GntR family transcriptional regulator